MINAKEMIKKGSWTGEELGRLAFMDSVIAHKNLSITNNPESKGIVDEKTFQRMVDKLPKTQENIDAYNAFIDLKDWFITVMRMAEAHDKQIRLYTLQLINLMENAITAEEVYGHEQSQPFSLTEKQKEDLERELLEKLSRNESAESTILSLIDNALFHYKKHLEMYPTRKNPLKKLKASLEKEMASHDILYGYGNEKQSYNVLTHNGYYVAEDGTRSDKVSNGEWLLKTDPLLAVVEDKKAREVLLGIMNKVSENEYKEKELVDIAKREMHKRGLREVGAMFNSALSPEESYKTVTQNEADERIERLKRKTTWKPYLEQPEVTKWDLLIKVNVFEMLGDENTEAEIIAQRFTEEFPGVAEALLKEMCKESPELEWLLSIPVKEWGNVTVRDEELYRLDVIGYKKLLFIQHIGEKYGHTAEMRALCNGVAVVDFAYMAEPHRTDKKGYYKGAQIDTAIVNKLGLYKYLESTPGHAKHIKTIEKARDTLLLSLYFMKGLNVVIDMLIELFGLDGLEEVKTNESYYDSLVEKYNELVLLLYYRINDIDYTEEKLKQEKLKAIMDVFYPINIKDTEPPARKRKQAEKYILDGTAWAEPKHSPLYVLCTRNAD